MRFIAASAVLSVVLWAVERPGVGDVHRGDAALKKRDYAAAAEFYLKARVLDPKNAGIYRRLATISERTGDLVNANSIYAQCLVMDGREGECRRGRARVTARLNRRPRPVQ